MRESVLTDGISVSRRKSGKKSKEQFEESGQGFIAGIFTALFDRVRHRPVRALAVVGLCAVTGGIFVNALFLQSQRHPAPFFAKKLIAERIARSAKEAKAAAAIAAAKRRAEERRAAAAVEAARLAAMAEHSQRSAHVAGLTSTARAPNNDKPSRTTAVQRSTVTARQEAGKADGGKKGVRQPGPARDLIGSLIRGEKYSTPRPPRDIPARNRSEPGNLRSAATVKDKQRIVSMQRALVKLGYPLTVDGIAGPATKAALEKFQRNNRLPASGRPGGRTLQVLASRARVPIP